SPMSATASPGWIFSHSMSGGFMSRIIVVNRPMSCIRIVHVLGTPVGAPWLINLAREQRRLGHDVHVVLPSLDGTIAPALAEAGVTCHVAALDILSMPGNLDRMRAVAALV